MTAFLNEQDFHSGTAPDVQVWQCESCKCVHVRANQVLLTFTKEEFAGFTEAVLDCHYGTSFFGANQTKDESESLPILISEMES